MHIDFGTWKGSELTLAHTYRFPHRPQPVQEADCLLAGVNAEHPQGFDNFALFCPQPVSAGAKASIVCSFEDLGCPEIVLFEKPETGEDGAVRYGACIEVVLYKDGVNVWRHYQDENKQVWWDLRLGVKFPVSEHEKHTLEVETAPQQLLFRVDGHEAVLRIEDLFDSFCLGLSMCEGITRIYEMTLEADNLAG